jgi:clan AA aspartic protease
MITGRVNSLLEATINVVIESSDGKAHQIEAVVDTGFNGSLTLPPTFISAISLPWFTRGTILLADGSQVEVDVYAATINWDGVSRRLLVQAADTEPLVGMALLRRHMVQIHVIDGGLVEIEALN